MNNTVSSWLAESGSRWYSHCTPSSHFVLSRDSLSTMNKSGSTTVPDTKLNLSRFPLFSFAKPMLRFGLRWPLRLHLRCFLRFSSFETDTIAELHRMTTNGLVSTLLLFRVQRPKCCNYICTPYQRRRTPIEGGSCRLVHQQDGTTIPTRPMRLRNHSHLGPNHQRLWSIVKLLSEVR